MARRHRSSLRAAKTVAEVQAVLADGLARSFGRPVVVDIDYPGASVRAFRDHAEGLLRCAERYPKANLQAVKTYDGKGIAAALGYGVIGFNRARNTRQQAPRTARRQFWGSLTGFQPWATRDRIGVTLHEFGHLLQQTAMAWGNHRAVDAPRVLDLVSEDRRRAGAARGPGVWEALKAFGGYSLDFLSGIPNLFELGANAFAVVERTRRPPRLAVEVHGHLMRAIGEQPVGVRPRTRNFSPLAALRSATELYKNPQLWVRVGEELLGDLRHAVRRRPPVAAVGSGEPGRAPAGWAPATAASLSNSAGAPPSAPRPAAVSPQSTPMTAGLLGHSNIMASHEVFNSRATGTRLPTVHVYHAPRRQPAAQRAVGNGIGRERSARLGP